MDLVQLSILIVDDSRSFRSALQLQLSLKMSEQPDIEYTVFEAADLKTAIECLENNRIDLGFFDLQFPYIFADKPEDELSEDEKPKKNNGYQLYQIATNKYNVDACICTGWGLHHIIPKFDIAEDHIFTGKDAEGALDWLIQQGVKRKNAHRTIKAVA